MMYAAYIRIWTSNKTHVLYHQLWLLKSYIEIFCKPSRYEVMAIMKSRKNHQWQNRWHLTVYMMRQKQAGHSVGMMTNDMECITSRNINKGVYINTW